MLALRPETDHPQVISTSRHITQGMVDLADEKWDGPSRQLGGRSRVIAGDAYELRIWLRSTRGVWTAGAVELSAEDRAAGVKATIKAEEGLARITFESPATREVRWTVRCEPNAR